MSVCIELKLKPFTTPNFILVEEPPKSRHLGFQEGRKFSLTEIGALELSALCDKFRSDIFKKAGKTDPSLTTSKARKGRWRDEDIN